MLHAKRCRLQCLHVYCLLARLWETGIQRCETESAKYAISMQYIVPVASTLTLSSNTHGQGKSTICTLSAIKNPQTPTGINIINSTGLLMSSPSIHMH